MMLVRCTACVCGGVARADAGVLRPSPAGSSGQRSLVVARTPDLRRLDRGPSRLAITCTSPLLFFDLLSLFSNEPQILVFEQDPRQPSQMYDFPTVVRRRYAPPL